LRQGQSGHRVDRTQWIGEQSVALYLDDLVALTNPGFQAGTVDDRYVATTIANQAGVLELMRRNGYALPAYSEDACNQLLRHDQLVRLSAIKTQKKTPAESLIN
jgi:hypothetical protein